MHRTLFRRLIVPAVVVLVVSGTASAVRAESTDPGMAAWTTFAEARTGECIGPRGELDTSIAIEAGRHRYRLQGHRLIQLSRDQDQILRIGVMSAVKDEREATLHAIKTVLAQLKTRGIDVLVVNGDIAESGVSPDELIFPALADSGVLTVVHVGNTESCGWFNQTATLVFRRHRNLINGNWVRQLELDDGTLYVLPGYYDRRFTHTGGAAVYSAEDIEEFGRLLTEGRAPKIVVSHGPPRMKGRRGIDIATGAGHVGDPALTTVLKAHKIRFGLFGHILEAGGRGSDLSGRKRRRTKSWHPTLFVNAGTINPDPWPMLDGRTRYGMGLYVEVKGKKARFETILLPPPTD